MRRALALARRGRYTAAPNPMVGAVVVAADGSIAGEGWHRRAGEPHAEVLALAAAGERARGAAVHVTLEPCAHFGRTPPCADALVAAGVAKVVASHRDPDRRTAGRGFAQLAAAGIEIEVGAAAEAALELNLAYLTHRLRHRPAVTLKWAASLDGKTATATGASRWITGDAARRRALELREEHDAVLVGSGTVLADDPLLTRRLGLAGRANLRVVLDRRLRVPPGARLFTGAGEVAIFTESRDADKRAALEARGARVLVLPAVEPRAVLVELGGRGVSSVLVEGGGEVAASFVASGLWERVVAFVAPKLVGGRGAPTPLGGAGGAGLERAPGVERVSVRHRGADLEIAGVRAGCLRELSSRLAG
jgi:diaminohydroxyphosphoribosylaminopyrimidine deaminase/5-amino-6-(5-phosphoribosylamino)uracil reductase